MFDLFNPLQRDLMAKALSRGADLGRLPEKAFRAVRSRNSD